MGVAASDAARNAAAEREAAAKRAAAEKEEAARLAATEAASAADSAAKGVAEKPAGESAGASADNETVAGAGQKKKDEDKPEGPPDPSGVKDLVSFQKYVDSLVKWANDPKNKSPDLLAAESALKEALQGLVRGAAGGVGRGIVAAAEKIWDKTAEGCGKLAGLFKRAEAALPVTSSSLDDDISRAAAAAAATTGLNPLSSIDQPPTQSQVAGAAVNPTIPSVIPEVPEPGADNRAAPGLGGK